MANSQRGVCLYRFSKVFYIFSIHSHSRTPGRATWASAHKMQTPGLHTALLTHFCLPGMCSCRCQYMWHRVIKWNFPYKKLAKVRAKLTPETNISKWFYFLAGSEWFLPIWKINCSNYFLKILKSSEHHQKQYKNMVLTRMDIGIVILMSKPSRMIRWKSISDVRELILCFCLFLLVYFVGNAIFAGPITFSPTTSSLGK